MAQAYKHWIYRDERLKLRKIGENESVHLSIIPLEKESKMVEKKSKKHHNFYFLKAVMCPLLFIDQGPDQ